MKILTLFFLFIIGLISCTNSEDNTNKLQLAEKYYKALDNSDYAAMITVLTDSLLTKETEYDYEQTFSLKEYIEWLKWDSMFDPTYNIVHIKQEDEVVKVEISKIDKRIQFLHEGPIISNQIVRFNNDKIISVETTGYVSFDNSTFVKNRDSLISWIDSNHPDLNGFLNDQTETSARKYLKAIELYSDRK